jgi:ABC-type uncharacterized transport system permease subunit
MPAAADFLRKKAGNVASRAGAVFLLKVFQFSIPAAFIFTYPVNSVDNNAALITWWFTGQNSLV